MRNDVFIARKSIDKCNCKIFKISIERSQTHLFTVIRSSKEFANPQEKRCNLGAISQSDYFFENTLIEMFYSEQFKYVTKRVKRVV